MMRSDVLGGTTAALVMLAIEGSYGLIAFAPLGPSYAQVGFMLAIFTAIVANVVMGLAGARGPVLSGSSAPLGLLAASLLATLLHGQGLVVGADGRPDAMRLLALVAVGMMLAGVGQLLLGVLRVGRVIRYVPYPVNAGFSAGVAVLMAIAIAPHVLGLEPGARVVASWRQTQPLAVLVALVTLGVALRPPAFARRLPRPLTALAIGSALHFALVAAFGSERLGPVLGPIALAWPDVAWFGTLGAVFVDGSVLRHWAALLQFALAVVAVGGLQTLMAQSLVESETRTRGDGERVLFAAGVSNVVTGLVGGMPSGCAVARSKINVDAGSRGDLSRYVYAAVLLLAATAGAGLLRHLPLAVVAGLFLATGWNLVDAWTRRSTRSVLAAALRGRRVPQPLRGDYAVMLTVALIVGLVSLPYGVAAGVLLSMISFVRTQSLQPVRHVASALRRRSLKVRDAAANALLREHGARIAVIELDGALFFGTADLVAGQIEHSAREAEQVIVDFRRVTDVDASGARLLVQSADTLRGNGRRLLLAGLAPAWVALLREFDVRRRLTDADLLPDVDSALELAEDRLLAQAQSAPATAGRLPLQHTQLGAGLAPDEIGVLGALLSERRYAAGETIFRRGDAADALFVAVSGEVGIWAVDDSTAPAPTRRRLVSFAPGVPFGEMGLLQRQPRSADAVAADATTVLSLDAPAFEQLRAQHPLLFGKLLLNLNLHLASRVRGLTDELQGALQTR